jgi:hypothetical protein
MMKSRGWIHAAVRGEVGTVRRSVGRPDDDEGVTHPQVRPDPALVAMSGIEAHVLHADDFLALMLGDGVPDCHVVGGRCSS